MSNKEVICECGKTITGYSEKHLKSNLKIHKKSKLHKELMINKSKEGVN